MISVKRFKPAAALLSRVVTVLLALTIIHPHLHLLYLTSQSSLQELCGDG